MTTQADFYELLRHCPLDCPFLRKKKDAHIFLCLTYRSFLEIDEKTGRVKRFRNCGSSVSYQEYNNFKNLLNNLQKTNPVQFCPQENKTLENLFFALDKVEQVVMMRLLETSSLIIPFLKQVERNIFNEDFLQSMKQVIRKYADRELSHDTVLQLKLARLPEANKGTGFVDAQQ